MSKNNPRYECTSCGAVFPKWSGKCNVCGEWDTVVEKAPAPPSAPGVRSGPGFAVKARPIPLEEAAADQAAEERMRTGSREIDNILGGGMVSGSLILLGGDPGIGKSTLMLQLAGHLAVSGRKVLYLTGEESAAQIGLRARRLGINGGKRLVLLTETCFEAIEQVVVSEDPSVLVVDSIQTIYVGALGGIPGSIAQVRESAAGFMRLAKQGGLTVFLVGHVTKDGSIAGPRLLEHMVDTVLYFEGDSNLACRILRVVKNRFGSTNEIGVFEMSGSGLTEVPDLSGYFLAGRSKGTPGSAVVCTLEGTRPLLVETQALVTPSGYGTAQRVSTGYDSRRLAIMLAILEKRLGLPFSSQDVFVNLAGGLRVEEPAVDLGVCAGLCSSLREKALDENTIFVGEVGLGGELRAVSHLDRRMAEAAKLGFQRLVAPSAHLDRVPAPRGLKVEGYQTLAEAIGNSLR